MEIGRERYLERLIAHKGNQRAGAHEMHWPLFFLLKKVFK